MKKTDSKSIYQFLIAFSYFSFYIIERLDDSDKNLTTGSGKQFVVAAKSLCMKIPLV